MVKRKTRPVSLAVDKDFFEKSFEPARVRMSKKLGVDVSQRTFTRMMFQSKIKLDPKIFLNESLNAKTRRRKKR